MTTTDRPTTDAGGSEQAPQKRDISTLLALGTYQGMSDEEVQSVIDYYVSLAHMDSESSAHRTAAQAMIETNTETMADIQSSSDAMLKKILGTMSVYGASENSTAEIKSFTPKEMQ